MGPPLDRRFKSRRSRSAVNIHNLLRAWDRDFGMGRATSTLSREEACGGADMTQVRNPDSGLGAGMVAGGRSGVTDSGSEGVCVREVER